MPDVVPAAPPRPRPPSASRPRIAGATRARAQRSAPGGGARLLRNGFDPRPGAGGFRRPGGLRHRRRRQVGRERGGPIRRSGHSLQRGGRVRRRVRHRRPPPPAGDPARAWCPGPERQGAGDVRPSSRADGPRHPCDLLLRPEGLGGAAARRVSRVLRRPTVHQGRRADADHQARDAHEPLPGQRFGPCRKSSRHLRARQPGEGRVGPGSRVLQHRVWLPAHDRARRCDAMAVTFARGFRAGTAACGIKAFTTGASAIPTNQRDDLCVIHSAHPCDTGGVFTTNKVKSASVVIDQLHLQRNRVQALTINSGNANACTGAQGFRDALLMAKLSADRLDLDPDQVLVSSTGVIGRFLPMDAIKSGIAAACGNLGGDSGEAAARAIMTTDTRPKTARVDVEVGDRAVRVGGMCKGSGMIHPNMATMLAYITTDAAVEPGLMSKLVKSVADLSFNQVTVDGDSSTNDSFLILANGAAGNQPIGAGSAQADALRDGLIQVARELARAIARDGEGATRLITVKVLEAASASEARTAARAVPSANLAMTAVHCVDPNWGRIVCALGYSGAELALDPPHLTGRGLV